MGDVVAVVLPPGPEVVAALGALWGEGAVPAVLDPRWGDAEIERALATLRPARVVRGGEGEMAESASEVRAAGLEEVGSSAGLAGSDAAASGARFDDPDRPAAIIWTSGSSGDPRAILLTAGNLDASAQATRERLDLRGDDRWALTLSPAHVGGLALVWRARAFGCGVVADGPFDVDRFVSWLREGRITHASLVPVMLRRVLDHPDLPARHALRAVLIGGAHASPELISEAFDRGIPVAPTYGMTEATSQVATAPPALARVKPASVGAPLPGVEVRVRDGEILVRGPTVARELETTRSGADAARSFAEPTQPADPPEGPRSWPTRPLADADGWYATGDLGEFDEDGHLRVTGRLGDRIITGGVTVSPAEVEAALMRLPGVTDAAVMGVPDPEWGEVVVAVLVGPEPMGVGAVRDALRGELAPARLPRRVLWLDFIPRNANGKVPRMAMRALIEGASGGG